MDSVTKGLMGAMPLRIFGLEPSLILCLNNLDAFCCIVCWQNASGCSISGSLASIAMSGKMKANPGSGRIWNQTNLMSLNVINVCVCAII